MATIKCVIVFLGLLVFTIAANPRNHLPKAKCEGLAATGNCQKKSGGNLLIQTHVKSEELTNIAVPGYTYGLGAQGTGDCPEGMERVLQQEECKTYAESQNPPWSYGGANCFQMNEGCLNNTGNIYFSTCNYTTIDVTHSAVCKKKADAAAPTNMTAVATSTTPIATNTTPIAANTTPSATNTTIEANTTSNATTTSDKSAIEASASESANQSNTTDLQVETHTVQLNWHRRRTDWNRRRHQACDTMSEDYTCPTTVSESETGFNVTRNGSTVCVESHPDEGWDFNVSVGCAKAAAAGAKAAAAGAEGNPATEQLFHVLDANEDGVVTKDEFSQSFDR